MTPKQVELALKKQRLQMQSAALRSTLAEQVSVWKPAFQLADRVQAGWIWLRKHPALPIAVLVATLVARPAGALRWARRSWFAVQTWRKMRDFIHRKLAPRTNNSH